MKTISIILVLLASANWVSAFSAYHHQRSYSSSGTSNSKECCNLSPWAYEHMNEVRQLANRLRQEYNSMSRGSSYSSRMSTNTAWGEDLIGISGKTQSELDALSRQMSEKLIADMRSGRIAYAQIAQPNYFEYQASAALENLNSEVEDLGQQQQQVQIDDGFGQIYPGNDLSKYDEVSHFAYPTEVKVVNGQTYVTRKNCTTATSRGGGGTAMNPLYNVLRVNRTHTISNSGPAYVPSNVPGSTSSLVQQHETYNRRGSSYASPGSSSLNRHSIYHHLNQDEIGVPNYSPQVTVDDSLLTRYNSYRPPIVIPVETENQDVEEFGSHNVMNQVGSLGGLQPSRTVTVRKYNRTVITGPDGQPIVTGSESKSVWDNGELVYDYQRPFGNWSSTKEDEWKREERERLFWIFQQPGATQQDLEEWQRRQEERLLGLTYRHNTTMEEIHEWQRRELDRYKALVGQYNTVASDLTDWQRKERGRIDWLIHQNSISREELDRWQRENQDKLMSLARQYHISIEELKEWQRKELERLYVIFTEQNSQMSSSMSKWKSDERNRLNNILQQHNSTVDQLQESIRRDQERLKELSNQYHVNVGEMEKWLKSELTRLSGIITQQQEEMKRITDWQRSERGRLEQIVQNHNITVEELEDQMKRDRVYMQSLAQKYHVSIEDLEKWQHTELERLHELGRQNLEKELKEWQRREREHLMSIIKKNDLTIEEFESKIKNDRARLQQLSTHYKVQVEEIEEWIKKEVNRMQGEGLLKQVEKELTEWQQKERDRLLAIVQKNNMTIEDLQKKINTDQTHLYSLANTYQVRVEEIEEWLKKELQRLQGEGLVKVEDLKEWQKSEREKLLLIVQENKLTIEEFEKRLSADKNRLQQLAKQYHIEMSDIESWLRKEAERLQNLGLIEAREKLNEWQKIERERLLALIRKNELSIEELEKKLQADQVHLHSMAYQYQVRVEEIEDWLKQEIKRLQNQGVIQISELKDWQKHERQQLQQLVQDRNLSLDEFQKWLQADHQRLQQLAMQQHIEIEEVEEWVRNEGNRLESLGLIKPTVPLTEWQQVESDHLQKITQEQNFVSTQEVEELLRQDRQHLTRLAQEYRVQVEEIEKWIHTELQRLRDQGKLQIDNLTTWQLAERDRLQALLEKNNYLTVSEFEEQLKRDRDHLKQLAFQHHTSVEEVEEWIRLEVQRLRDQGQLQIENLTVWQEAERNRLSDMIRKQSDLTVKELEAKLSADRAHVQQLAMQYHITVEEVENWIKKEVQRLRNLGQLKIKELTDWQLIEREYIKSLLHQKSNLSTVEFEEQLRRDHANLQQLAHDYHVSIEEVEQWMRQELLRLKNQGQLQIEKLAAWQLVERDYLKSLIQQKNDLSSSEFEMQLRKDREHLQQLALDYHITVEEVENWMRQELQRLRDQGKLQVENLTQWQVAERQRINDLIREQNNLSYEEFEERIRKDHARLQQLARKYHITVEEVEEWIRSESNRLQSMGFIQPSQELLKDWQQHERAQLTSLAHSTDLTLEDFEERLRNDRPRLQEIARTYHITVEEVEHWLRKEAQRLANMQIIHVDEVIDIWQKNERDHIQQLITQQPNHHQWSIEELERQLKNDRAHLEALAAQYHVTVEQVEEWYRRELDRMLRQKEIFSEQLSEWQRIEKDRLYLTLQQQHITLQELERQLFQDRNQLRRLAAQYRITVEELEKWQRNELKRLASLGLTKENSEAQDLDHEWQSQERQRLRTIAAEITITEEELVEFITNDQNYQRQLARNYSVPLEHLATFQRTELRTMHTEGLLDQTKLNHLEMWQKRERDRLYALIKGQNFNTQRLRDWQRQDAVLTMLAQQYKIDVATLKNWQLGEIERFERLAKHYKMTLNQLEDFRSKELRNIQVTTHKKTMTDAERIAWASKESVRMQVLARRSKLSGEALNEWRRRLYLLSQGLINQEYGVASGEGGFGGKELVTNTGLSGRRNQTISQDRGDQPPQVYEEEFEETEPGIPGAYNPNEPGLATDDNGPERPIYPSAPLPPARAQYTNVPPQQPIGYLPPQSPAPGYIESGRIYRKKEYSYTVPVGVTAGGRSTSGEDPAKYTTGAMGSPAVDGGNAYGYGNGDRYGQGQRNDQGTGYRYHSSRNDHFNSMESGSLTREIQPQQQQYEKDEDLGQQTQQLESDLEWTGSVGAGASHGQLQSRQRQLSTIDSNTNSGRYSGGSSISGTFGSNAAVQAAGSAGTTYASGSSSSRQYSDHYNSGQQQENVEEFGQQQVQLEDLRQSQDGSEQQQVQVEDISDHSQTSYGSHNYRQGSRSSPSSSQVNATDQQSEKIEVEAVEEEQGLWNKIKNKTKSIFSG